MVGKQARSRMLVDQKILMIINKQNSNRKICEAFYELPGSKSRLFMGCHASELNHLTKPFKMGLQLTNHRFNYDKFRVCKRLTCQMFGESFQEYLVGVAGKQRQDNPDFFGEYTWHPSLLQGSTKLCSLTRSPQVIYFWAVLAGYLCLSCVVHPTLFGPCNLGVKPLKWICKMMVKTQLRRSETTEALNYQGCRLYYTWS